MKLEDAFYGVYSKFKLHFYQEVFGHFSAREATLTTVESFCMETIYAMKEPTINEFASFLKISSPNAAYKVNNLIKKGYVEKVQSETDRREYHLRATQKYIDYYNISYHYVEEVVARLENNLDEADKEKLRSILEMMYKEFMPEVPNYDLEEKEE